MLEKYKDTQSIFYNFIVNSVNNNCVSHAYLIETNGVSYGYDLAVNLAKFFLCNREPLFEDRIIYEVDNGIYPDLYVINNQAGEIKKNDVIDLKRSFSVKSVNNNYRIYIINNANLLNSVSANALLKFLEEPEEDIIAVLLVDTRFDLIDTIVSRCQILSLVNNEFSLSSLFLDSFDNSCNFDEFINRNIEKIVDLYMLIEENNTFLLVNDYMYSFKDELYNFFVVGLYLYYDVFNLYYERSRCYLNGFDLEKEKIMKNNSINGIISKINLINDFINKSFTNMNKDLLMDDFIIKMLGVVSND